MTILAILKDNCNIMSGHTTAFLQISAYFSICAILIKMTASDSHTTEELCIMAAENGIPPSAYKNGHTIEEMCIRAAKNGIPSHNL